MSGHGEHEGGRMRPLRVEDMFSLKVDKQVSLSRSLALHKLGGHQHFEPRQRLRRTANIAAAGALSTIALTHCSPPATHSCTYTTTADDLRPLFDKYGEVGDIFIPADPFTKKSKGALWLPAAQC